VQATLPHPLVDDEKLRSAYIESLTVTQSPRSARSSLPMFAHQSGGDRRHNAHSSGYDHKGRRWTLCRILLRTLMVAGYLHTGWRSRNTHAFRIELGHHYAHVVFITGSSKRLELIEQPVFVEQQPPFLGEVLL
jgi:hypothetical protein